MFYQLLNSIAPEKELIPVIKQPSQDKLEQFGDVTGNNGVIHLDTKYCEKVYSHHKTFVFGFMLLAYISELMEVNFGRAWLETGAMDLKFIGPAHPGDTLIARGIIKETEENTDGTDVLCTCELVNQRGEKSVVGTTRVTLAR